MGSRLPNIHGEKIVIASHNPGKVSEISDLLSPLGLKPYSAKDLRLKEPDETGTTFIENSELKARTASQDSGLIALADDSGLVVPALGGAPGVFSARWTIDSNGENRGFLFAIDKIENEIKNMNIRPEGQQAHFVCALSLSWPSGQIITFEGFAHGSLTFPPKGSRGFGYDPIFKPKNSTLTFGEMIPAKKHLISHRANAFAKLSKKCLN